METVLARLIREHPSVRVVVANDNGANLLPRVRTRELDLAVVDLSFAEGDSQLHITRLSTYALHAIARAGHPALKLPQAEVLANLWNYPTVLPSRNAPLAFRQVAAKVLGLEPGTTAGTKAVPSIGCDSVSMMKNIVRRSDAVTGLPLCVVMDEIKRGELVAVLGPTWLQVSFGIVWLAHRSLSPLGDTFVRLVQEADAELAEWEERTARQLFGESKASLSS